MRGSTTIDKKPLNKVPESWDTHHEQRHKSNCCVYGEHLLAWISKLVDDGFVRNDLAVREQIGRETEEKKRRHNKRNAGL